MKELIARRHIIRNNWLSIVGFCLLGYFAYHAMLGDRSYIRLMGLEREIAKLSATYDDLSAERAVLESRVVMLRPGSIDRDLLEERVQHVLGYYHDDATVMLQ